MEQIGTRQPESRRYELYTLTFPNGKLYAGISYDAGIRFKDHKRSVKRGGHYPVHEAIRKYGEENTRLDIVAVGYMPYIQQLEIDYIEKFQLRDRQFGYNLAVGGEVSTMHAPEIAAKVSATKRRQFAEDRGMALATVAKMHTPEARAKALSSIRTPESRAKKSASTKGRPKTSKARAATKAALQKPETRAKLSASIKKAWSDPDLRARQSANLRGGKTNGKDPAARSAKISAALMGHPGFGKGEKRDPSVRAKISASKMGHAVSQETRDKIRATFLAKRARPVLPGEATVGQAGWHVGENE